MPEIKPPSVKRMFVERMRREGREPEWFARGKAAVEETGKHFSHIIFTVMRDMGYESVQKERELLAAHENSLHLTSSEKSRKKVQDEIREERKVKNFDEALRMLPNKASVSEEIDWIRAHPAMSKKNRQKDQINAVLVTAEDILQAPHGKAPSQAAVHQLQHWMNHPGEFFKQLLGEHKKKSEGDSGKGVESEHDLGKVERMLAEFSGVDEPVVVEDDDEEEECEVVG